MSYWVALFYLIGSLFFVVGSAFEMNSKLSPVQVGVQQTNEPWVVKCMRLCTSVECTRVNVLIVYYYYSPEIEALSSLWFLQLLAQSLATVSHPYFVGSLFFTAGSYLGFFEVLSAA